LRGSSRHLTAGGDFKLEINGSTLGTLYDNLNVTGGVSLGSADLFVALGDGFTPGAGETYTVVSNNLADPILGAFATINDDTFSLTNDLGTFAFKLRYNGEGPATSGGNDLVIEAVCGRVSWLCCSAGSACFSACAAAGHRRIPTHS
jgi:hypothetical protein